VHIVAELGVSIRNPLIAIPFLCRQALTIFARYFRLPFLLLFFVLKLASSALG